jgi:P22 coat protein - gene protein 5
MAHTFIKPESIVSMGLGMLRRELLLPRLVQRVAFDDFVGIKNDTVNIRIPARLNAREYGWRNDRTDGIVTDDITELSIPVTLDKHPYLAVALTDEQLKMDIRDFGAQVLEPEIRGVAEKLESYIAAKLASANYSKTVTYNANTGDFHKALISVRKELNKAFVPSAGRVVVLGANVEESVLNEATFKKVDQSGSDSVLREAVIGRVAGFTVIGNVNSIDPDACYAFHQSAFGFANAAPLVPGGAAFGATLTSDGFAMRWIKDYDADHMRDRSVVDAFAGAVSVEDGRNASTGALLNKNVRAVKVNFVAAS